MTEQRGEEPRSEQRSDVASVLTPVQETERIVTLDVLRGIALLGIFFANMAFFASPMLLMMDTSWVADETVGNWLAWAFVKVFIDGKFITLFSILFGVGMMVQLSRAQQKAGSFTMMFARRLIVLAIIGAVHALLIWYGDILLMYAVAGFALLLVQRMSAKGIVLFSAVLLVISLVMFLGMTALGVVMDQQSYAGESDTSPAMVDAASPGDAEAPSQDAAAPGEDDRFERFWNHLQRAQFNPNHPEHALAETVAYKEGPLSAAVTMRAITYAGFAVFMGIFTGFGLRIIAVFLIGAALMKMGFFKQENRRWHWRFFIIGVSVGLLCEFAALGVYHASNYEMTVPVMLTSVVPLFTSIILCLGYIGGVCLFVHSGALQWLQRALAAVGRMALTNYLAQSLIATFIFYWWGLGLFGEVDKATQLAIALSVYVGQIIFSVVWLNMFRFGPMEWLWRSLVYLKPQPMLRKVN